MKKFLSYSFIGAGLFIFTGCATLTSGPEQQVFITADKQVSGTISNPDGTNLQSFTTPATLKINKTSSNLIVSSKDNKFEPQLLKSEGNLWVLGNIFMPAGSFSTTTDLLTGSAWKYDEVVDLKSRK